MAKRKSRRKKRPTHKPAGWHKPLTDAYEHLDAGDAAAAHHILLPLAQKHPRSKQVLWAAVDACGQLHDLYGLAYVSEKLLPLEKGPERADVINNLTASFKELFYPALAWHYARELLATPSRPAYINVKDLEAYVADFQSLLEKESRQRRLLPDQPMEAQLTLLVQLARVRFYVESRYPEEAIALAEPLSEQYPTVVPLHNNLSLAYFDLGHIGPAQARAERALALDPDNYHALANLTRFAVLTGRFEAAQTLADRLKAVNNDGLDRWTKQAEALAYLGNDEGVRATLALVPAEEQAISPLLIFLNAVAHYRLDDVKTARRLWRQAAKLPGTQTMAQTCLNDLKRPVGERHIPWYFAFDSWFGVRLGQELADLAQKESDKSLDRAVRRYLQRLLQARPYLPQLLPHALIYGDQFTRKFCFNVVRTIDTPALAETLTDFVQSPYGPDEFRRQAINFLNDEHPDLLPKEPLIMWLNGEPTPLQLLNLIVTDEPEIPPEMPDRVVDLNEQIYYRLQDGKFHEAEPLIDELIAIAPDFPTAYNHRAQVYENTGRRTAARKLIEATHARFPDYLFGRVALARLLIGEEKYEEARDLLQPLLKQTRHHTSEFLAMVPAFIELALATEQQSEAEAWLELWKQVDPDSPQLAQFSLRVLGPTKSLSALKKLLGR